MKNKVITLVLMLSFLVNGHLMADNKKANRYFELFKYSKAIPLYMKAAQSTDLKTRSEAIVRLADCYRLTNNMPEARSWYARAVEDKDADPVNFYFLGMALRSLERYDEARNAFLRYSELKPEDERGKILADYAEKIELLRPLSDSVIIKNAALLNSKYSDFCPVYYKKGLVFTSDRKNELLDERTYDWTNYGYLDLYYSEPAYYQDFWTLFSAPVRMSNLFNQTYHDGPVSFSPDQHTIFVTRTLKTKVSKDKDNLRTNLMQIFYASLTGYKVTKYIPFTYNSENYSAGHPALSKDGKKLIFSSDMPGGHGGSDLYITELVDGNWSEPVNLGEQVNTFGSEVFPYWFNDTTLFFSSDGHMSFGGLDIFETVMRDGEWTAPENMLKPINSSYDDFGLVFRDDKKEGFFSSNRPGGKGADDIYAIQHYAKSKVIPAAKPEEEKTWISPYFACGYVKDKSTLQPLGDATVFILNPVNSKVLVLRSDSNGYYKTTFEKDKLYVIKAFKPDYFDDCIHFRMTAADSVKCNPVPRDLLLEHYSLNQVFTLQNIYYDLDKWNIRPDAKPELDRLIGILLNNPINIELSSHTDSRASDEYNLELSFKRAESAVRYIVMNGINSARITARGYGETRLVNHCANGVSCSEAEHQANRRTEFKITSTQSESFSKKVFDASPFKSGDVIPVQMLEPGFFKECFISDVTGSMGGTDEKGEASGVKPAIPSQQAADIKVVVPPHSEENIIYSVQVLAIAGLSGLNIPDLKGEENVILKSLGGYSKYFVGKYSDYDAAFSEKNRLQNKFPGAFIVAFKDGKVIPVNEMNVLNK